MQSHKRSQVFCIIINYFILNIMKNKKHHSSAEKSKHSSNFEAKEHTTHAFSTD